MSESLTIVLPFFNEEGWIGRTVASLASQSDSAVRLLLIDNGSTDAGALEALDHVASLGDRAMIVQCPTAGKIPAMAAGLALVETPLVAICDADTWYPPDYVATVQHLFAENPSAAAVMAIDLYAPPAHPASLRRARRITEKSRRFPTKCHAGGYAQAFRTDWLRAAGGFDVARWPYVLEDHEIMHRLQPYGPTVYHPDHACFPSDRRASRKAVSWTRGERLLYRYLPDFAMDWYFYRFLGQRLAARNSFGIALRQKDWSSAIA